MNPKVLEPLFNDDGKKTTITLTTPAFQQDDAQVLKVLEQLTERVSEHMNKFEVNKALEFISEALARCNEHLQLLAPWKKEVPQEAHRAKVHRAVYLTLETLRMTALCSQAVLPEKMKVLLEIIQVEEKNRTASTAMHLLQQFNLTKPSTRVKPLFPKIELPTLEEGKIQA